MTPGELDRTDRRHGPRLLGELACRLADVVDGHRLDARDHLVDGQHLAVQQEARTDAAMRAPESSSDSSVSARRLPVATASSRSVIPASPILSSSAVDQVEHLWRVLGRRADADRQRRRPPRSGPGRTTPRRRDRASRGSPGRAGSRSRHRGRGSRERPPTALSSWRPQVRAPTTRCACSVGRRLAATADRRELRTGAHGCAAAAPRLEPAGRSRLRGSCGRRRRQRRRRGSRCGSARRRKPGSLPHSETATLSCVPRTSRPSGCSGNSAAEHCSIAKSAGSSACIRISSRITWRSASISSGRSAGSVMIAPSTSRPSGRSSARSRR